MWKFGKQEENALVVFVGKNGLLFKNNFKSL
jgi:hypothetical protein